MLASIVSIFEQSKDDPFFWISHVVVVAMTGYIVYNLWTRKDKNNEL